MDTSATTPVTPSRLRPPTQRRSIADTAAKNANASGGLATAEAQPDACDRQKPQKPKLESPKASRQPKAVPVLPQQLSVPLVSADGMSKTYKSTAAATARPAPVTKPAFGRNGQRLLAGSRSGMRGSMSASQENTSSELKGRLEEMERMMEEMRKRMATSTLSQESNQIHLGQLEDSLKASEDLKRRLESRLIAKEEEISELSEEIRRIKKSHFDEMESKAMELQSLRSGFSGELDEVRQQRDRCSKELDAVKLALDSSKQEAESLRLALSRQATTVLECESQIQSLKVKLGSTEAALQDRTLDATRLLSQLSDAQSALQEANSKLHAGETLRRKLHNMVQELKGNIRVFCRVRPLMGSELDPNQSPAEQLSHIAIGVNSDEQEEIVMTQAAEGASGGAMTRPYPFTFDKVFGPSASQEDVFDEISQLVQSALDGYKVCIFAYGQTGSGKTFTMEGGGADDPAKIGMIPRAVHQIFESTRNLGEKGWNFEFQVSYLEIYNETIRDLLASKADSDHKLEIKHVDGRTHVTDLTVEPVADASTIFKFLKKAAQNRAVAETQCNERSSRSHSVFTLKIAGSNAVTTEKVDGILNLIDLAGSERLSQSGSTGDRLKETQAINKSLSALGDVIHALANKEAHIPYRNSKLTYLLQHSLGGNCKTLMFVNVSPAYSNFQETLCSLRFATKVNSCQIGTATKRSLK